MRFAGDGPLSGVFSVSRTAPWSRGRTWATRGWTCRRRASLLESVEGELQVVRLKNLPGETQATTYSSVVEIKTGEIMEDINHYVATSEQREGALSAGVS